MRITNLEPEFIFICVKHGVTEQLAWRLFDHIQEKDGLLSEYEIRIYLGVGEERAKSLIEKLVQGQYAEDEAIYDKDGKKYVNELPDEDVDLLAEVELRVRKPLWQ